MNKLLVICGPTATGKTKLAVKMASKLDGELVSADSRQVYCGLDIGTGKDYNLLKGVKFWGYDLAQAKDSYSVGQYIKFAEKTISDIHKRNKLPILVGGTGLYVKGVIDGIETSKISKNKALRKSLENKNSEELFEILAQLDSVRAASLNSSDKKNPRRLIRAIELVEAKDKGTESKSHRRKYELLMIGLRADKGVLDEKIRKRVNKRVKIGIKEEIKKLLKSGVSWNDQSMSSLGYRQWRGYFEKNISQKQVIESWTKQEQQYAKRQMTWFRRDERIKWFDAGQNDLHRKVEEMIKRWYSSSRPK